MKKSKRELLLAGEGANSHILNGNFEIETDVLDFKKIVVNELSLLNHETPDGLFAEHNTLKIKKGNWVMGKQVEYNPFKQEITRVWD